MQLDYINIGKRPGKCGFGGSEFIRKIKTENPTVLTMTSIKDNPVIGIAGQTPLNKVIKVENIPTNAQIVRTYYSGENVPNTGAIVLDNDFIWLVLFMPKNYDVQEVTKKLMASVAEAAHKNKVKVFAVDNDIFMDTGEHKKKFCGYSLHEWEGWWSMEVFISLEVNWEIMRVIYDFTAEKFTKKGNFGDISNIVGGLKECNPNLDYSFSQEVIEAIGNRFKLEVKPRILTDEEEKDYQWLIEQMDIDSWKYDGIYPFQKLWIF